MAPNEMAPQRLGNTKAKRWQLTLNDCGRYEDLISYLLKLKSLKYLISCKELAPTTNHEHIHIYVCFSGSVKLSINKLCGAHVESCRGSHKQNIDYIRKDGVILDEVGEEPRERGGSHTVAELKQIQNPDELDFKEYNTWSKIRSKEEDKNIFFNMLEEISMNNLHAPTIYYITGGTGKGKTFSAYKMALERYKKEEIGKLTLKNEFVDIINEDAKCYVIEEFRPSQIKASDFLQLTDKYGYRCNIKGGFKTLRPECIIICSIIPPTEIYKEEVNKQFLRRITEIIDLDEIKPLNDDVL